MKFIITLISFMLSLNAQALVIMSNTRETSVIKDQGKFSFGLGYTSLASPFRGPNVRDEVNPGIMFFGARYGLFENLEAQITGMFLPFFPFNAEARIKWLFFNNNTWLLSASGFAFRESETPEAKNQRYVSQGFGGSGTISYAWDDRFTPYVGGRISNLILEYKDEVNAIELTFDDYVVSGFVGLTWQFKLMGAPLDLDTMISFNQVPETLETDALTVDTGITLSLWWKH